MHWNKEHIRVYVEARGPDFSHAGYLAWDYERLGLIEDSDYWMADAMAHTPQPEQRFFFKEWQFRMRGDLAGLRAETDKLRAALGTDIDRLQGQDASKYAAANIYIKNFDVGIDAFETGFDLDSISELYELFPAGGLGSLHLLAYAYQQVGRDDEADALLIRLHDRLNVFVVERNMDNRQLHHLRAQNFGLSGDFDAAADTLEAAIEAGWMQYFLVMNDPSWAKTIANPRIAHILDDVKVELERQRAIVEQADAEHDFRAEYEAMRSNFGD